MVKTEWGGPVVLGLEPPTASPIREVEAPQEGRREMKRTNRASRDYLRIVEWSEEDGCFVGSAPPLIGRCCHGDTEASVLRQLGRIVEEWLAASSS